MAYALRAKGHETVAVGVVSPSALNALGTWAERIVVMQAKYLGLVPEIHLAKTVVVDVGPDVWGNPLNPELQRIVSTRASEALRGD